MSLQPVGSHLSDALARLMPEGVEVLPRKPRYWAEGQVVVSSTQKRMDVAQAQSLLVTMVQDTLTESFDELADRMALNVADLVLAIRDALRFGPTGPANDAVAMVEAA